MKKILITGGCGFIGSCLVRYLIQNTNYKILNVDKLTYAGDQQSLQSIENNPRYTFRKTCICDADAIEALINDFQPTAIMHLAAESHVDNSIANPEAFIQTNVFGTYNLLNQTYKYWMTLDEDEKESFRFHHISTDEVYGDLPNDPSVLFTETTPYAPSSPYSASKASSDHLVRAWQRTYKLPTLITNCSNNYGEYQYPEKLIPHVILKALEGGHIPVYGDGSQVRDWLYVDDHVRALVCVLHYGEVGETYNIGGHNEVKNIDVVKSICNILEELVPDSKPDDIEKFEDLITFVEDRAGHDTRYAIDASKIKNELGWIPNETFESGLRKTVIWYLQNSWWTDSIRHGK